jgi:hypothetical protein
MDNRQKNSVLDAVRNDELDQLRESLRRPALDATQLNEAAAVAAGAGKPLYATLLLRAGADPDLIRPHLKELVTNAAGEGLFEALKDLLKMGGDPNAPNQESVTPLCASAAYGHTGCVELLLKAGADPNRRAHGGTPLQLAAAFGHASVVAALLEGGADASLHDPVGRGLPQFLAHRHGHQELAAKIRNYVWETRKQRAISHFRAAGWDPSPAPGGIPRLIVSGTQLRDPKEVFTAATEVVDIDATVDLPFTKFEGWLKQINPEELDVMRCEALDAAFPLFLNQEAPEADFLPRELPGDQPPRGVKLNRERRFAGDPYLPRARYFTVCDEQGRDFETLKYELLAYRYPPFSGRIQLIDCTESDAGDQLGQFGMKPPGDRCFVLVFLPSKNSLNPFLFKAGFPQRPVGQILTLHIEHVCIQKTIDLRVPATAEWFARFFSRLVQDISGHSKTQQKSLRCWPFRPALRSFSEILPAVLTQEPGGNTLTSSIGAWLRKAGAEALVFPSARNDSYLIVDSGHPTAYGGWNLVDFRRAHPVREQVFLDVDDYWPKDIRLGPGTSLLERVPPNPFRFVSLTFTERGKYAGSFQIEKMSSTMNTLFQMELEAFENGQPVRPWWAWSNYAETGL